MTVTAILYAPAGTFQFLGYDDRQDVYDNPRITGGLTGENIVWALTSGERANWFPLTRLSLQTDFEYARLTDGSAAAVVHVVNVALHVLATVLLYLALRWLTGAAWQSAVAAALFALHPLHIESVAWAVERKDVLSAVFWMLTLLAYAWYAQRRSVGRYLAVALCLALGLMAKPMLVTLPFVLLLLDYWPLGQRRLGGAEASEGRSRGDPAERSKASRRAAKREALRPGSGQVSPPAPAKNDRSAQAVSTRWLLLEKVPLVLLAVASCVVTYEVQRVGGAMTYADRFPYITCLAQVPVAYMTYLLKMLWPAWPFDLAVYYPFQADLPLWQPVAATAALVLITALVIWQIRRRPYLAVGWLWYVGTLVPVIGFVPVGMHSMADRYTYVPLVGIFIMVIWGAVDLVASRPWRWWVLWPVAAAALAGCVYVTHYTLPYWADTITLFNRDLAVVADNHTARYNLGDWYLLMGMAFDKQGRHEAARVPYQEAVAQYERAIELNPTVAEVINNLGWVRGELGQDEQAEKCFRKALEVNPKLASAHNNLGRLYLKLNHSAEALAEYQKALDLEPNMTQAMANAGMLLAGTDRPQDALPYLYRAVELAPAWDVVHKYLGTSLAALGRHGEAMAQFREALRLRPDSPEVSRQIAYLLAVSTDRTVRDGPQAVAIAEQLRGPFATPVELVMTLDTQAVAYAEVGRFDQAVAAEQRAIDEAVKFNLPPRFLNSFQSRQAAFRANKPWREGPPRP